MKYKGEKFTTYSDIIDRALKLKGKEQELFVRAYLRSGKFARTNIGYFSGYYDLNTMAKIQKIFKTEHPIFGPSR